MVRGVHGIGLAALICAALLGSPSVAQSLNEAVAPIADAFARQLARRNLGGPGDPVDIYLKRPAHADYEVACQPMSRTLRRAFLTAFEAARFREGRVAANLISRQLLEEGEMALALSWRRGVGGAVTVRGLFGTLRGRTELPGGLPSVSIPAERFSARDRQCLFDVAANRDEPFRTAERTIEVRRDLGSISRRNRIGFIREGEAYLLKGWLTGTDEDWAIVEILDDDPLAEVVGFAAIDRPEPPEAEESDKEDRAKVDPDSPEAEEPDTKPAPEKTGSASQAKKYEPLSTFRDCPDCPEMVVIPAGSFLMGSPSGEKGRDDDEGPRHRRAIDKFALAATEVTVGAFRRFVRETGHDASGGCYTWTGSEWEKQSGLSWRDPGFSQGADHPVACVSWEDAKAYIDWLNGKVSGDPYRLPSEAEWEYAARAGTTTPFAFGATISTRQANYDGNYTYGSGREGVYRGKTVPVGDLDAANRWGLRHMHGNVYEWVEDCWHDSYSGAPSDGRAWLDEDRGNCSRLTCPIFQGHS